MVVGCVGPHELCDESIEVIIGKRNCPRCGLASHSKERARIFLLSDDGSQDPEEKVPGLADLYALVGSDEGCDGTHVRHPRERR